MSYRKFAQQVLSILTLSVLIMMPAYALELKDAKVQGLVGETSSGYLAAVQASGEVKALVADINKKRKAHYQKIAKKNAISLEAVEVRAGQKAIDKTAAGQYVNTGSGWVKK